MAEKTTIQLDVTTRNRLAEFGRKPESYDDLVNRLLDEIEEYKKG